MAEKCIYCGRKMSRSIYMNMCSICQFLFLNKENNIIFETEDGIIITMDKNKKHISCFMYWGEIPIPKSIIEKFNNTKELIDFCREMKKNNITICSKCHKQFNNKDIEFSNIEVIFCKTCFEKYKQENSRVCNICKRPIYDCSC